MPGEILLFSGAQLYASIPNTFGYGRFSVDLRAFDVGNLTAGRGAHMSNTHQVAAIHEAVRRVVAVRPLVFGRSDSESFGKAELHS